MKKNIIIFVFLLTSALGAYQKALVRVPVTSLWVNPNPDDSRGPYKLPLFGSKTVPNHVSQLLSGERVEIVQDNGLGWYEVRALEQTVLNVSPDKRIREWDVACRWVRSQDLILVNKLPEYNGVISCQLAPVYEKLDTQALPISTLSIGTLLEIIDSDFIWCTVLLPDLKLAFIETKNINFLDNNLTIPALREVITQRAKSFLESLYCAGGRSAYQKDVTHFITSVDCSGLIDLSYRSCGISIPRHAFAQYEKSVKITPQEILPGDLIFIKRVSKISHVMMWLGYGDIIEASGNVKVQDCKTRIIKDTEKLGRPLTSLKNGDQCVLGDDIFKIYCGSFLSDQKLIKELQALLILP